MKMCRLFLTLLLASCFTLPAAAQSACGKRDEIVRMITNKYKEVPRALAIAGQSNLLEVYASEGGSWTILITQPHGSACIVAAGQSWEEFPAQKRMTGL